MKLEGPLMSIAAHGTIAKALTFSMRAGHARAAIYRPPHDARTQTQLNQRAHYLDGTRLWKLMTDADRLAWTQTHQLPNASGYNTFVQTIMNRITRNRDWLHKDFFSSDRALQNFILVHLMENYAGSTFLDISGHHRDWAPTNTTQEQGNRAMCALVTGSTASVLVANSALLGHSTAITLGVRFYTSTPQGSLPATIYPMNNYNYGWDAGFLLGIETTRFRFRIGDGTNEPDLYASSLYTPNMWTTLLAIFDGNDSGRMTLVLNGAVIGTRTSAAIRAANSPTAIALGSSAGGTPFPGYIDNAVIYAGATSALRL